jgi:hypothetical protein
MTWSMTPSTVPTPAPALSPPLLPSPSTPLAPEPSIEPPAHAPSDAMHATAPLPPPNEAPRRRRRGGKRVKFQHLPPPPLPVRSLWTAASDEERQQAHKSCSVMLTYWLGKIGKSEAATQLGVSELRVWQLSQQALGAWRRGS